MPSFGQMLSRRQVMAAGAGAAAVSVFGRGQGIAQDAGSTSIQPTPSPDASSQFRVLAEGMMQAMVEAQVPGAQIGIYHDGKTETAAFGVADITTMSPVTTDTRFEMGSITKTYTATAVMRLVEAGQIDLDVPVRTYVPDLQLADASVAERVTTRHLLTHTGGWYGDILFRSPSDDEAIAWLVRDKLPTLPQVAPLGAHYAYNNTGFVLLGHLLEVVVGKPYRRALRDLVLAPLGLETAVFGEVVQRSSYAQSHGVGKNGVEVVSPLQIPRAYEPTGGLWTTIDDQLRYARFHLGDGGLDGVRVLRPATVRAMQTPQVAVPGSRASAGMNWLTTDRDGQRRLQHAGQTFGQVAQLVLVPEERFAIAVLTNSSSGLAVMPAAIGGAFEEYFGIDPNGAQGSSQPVTPTPLSTDQLAEYAGSYTVPDLDFTLRLDNGGLVFSADLTLLPDQELGSILPELPRNAPVTFVGPDAAVAVSGPNAAMAFSFVRKPDGGIGWLASEARLYPRTGSA